MESTLLQEQEIAACDMSISTLMGKVREFERSYESLREFKEIVSNSYDDFNFINSRKSRILWELEEFQGKNPVAKKYKAGMTNSLTGIGMSVVGLSFQGLLVMIDVKMAEYWNAIKINEAEIARLEFKKSAAQAAIDAL